MTKDELFRALESLPTPEEAKRLAKETKKAIARLKEKAEVGERLDRIEKRIGVKDARYKEAIERPQDVARDLFNLVEGRLTAEERDLRDWLQAGGTGRGWERAKGRTEGTAKRLRRKIEEKYERAKLEPPFTRSIGGRPRKVRIVAAGTVEAAEGIARKAGGEPSA